jgi:NAD(P)-dependent dehydrogenase (short-subunit alcohol dehydrogenase family)
MTNGPPRVWLVTGASSGFGAAAAQAALDAGETVIATARRREEILARLGESRGRLHIDAFDVTDHEQADAPLPQPPTRPDESTYSSIAPATASRVESRRPNQSASSRSSAPTCSV